MDKFFKMFGSKKFTVSVSVILVAIFNSVFGWNIPPETIEKVIYLAIGFVGAQGIADGFSGGATSSLVKGNK